MTLKVFRTLWQDPSQQNAEGLEEPSEAHHRTILLRIAALVIPPVIFFVYFQRMFVCLINTDALDMAQLARNLAHGHGFTTYILRPLATSVIHGGGPLHQPDVIHGPLYPFLQALAFGIMGPSDHTAALVSGLFFLLLIPVVFTLGKKVFNTQVGLTVAGLLSVNALLLEYATSGMHITLFIFLTTCLMLALHNLCVFVKDPNAESADVPKGKLAWIGVLSALLYLTDSIFIWFVPAVLFFVMGLGGAKRLKYALFFLFPLFALTLPWMARNFMLTGNPVFGLRGMEFWMNTKGHYPGDTAYRYAMDDLVRGKELFRSIILKILLGIGNVIDTFPQVNASWILAFLLPSLLFRFTDTAAHSLRRVMMWCFLGILVGLLIFQAGQMYFFVAIIPTMLVFSVAFLMHLMQQAQLHRSGVMLTSSLIVVAAAYPLLSKMTIQDRQLELKEIAVAKELKAMTKRNEVVISDQPWFTAWYGDRPSVMMPAIDGKIAQTRSQFRANWLFVTSAVSNPQNNYNAEAWKMVYMNLQQWQVNRFKADMFDKQYVKPMLAAAPGVNVSSDDKSKILQQFELLTSNTKPILLAPSGKNVPLFDALSEFQSVNQKLIYSEGRKPSLPAAFIAEAPTPERVGMTTTANKQFAR